MRRAVPVRRLERVAHLARCRQRQALDGHRWPAHVTAQAFELREWSQLSDRVRILCAPDPNQDAAALIALGEQCAVLNLNDGAALGTRARLLSSFKSFSRRFVLRLINYGDADMINFFTESGERITPICADKTPLGYLYSGLLKDWDGTHTAPFSCNHTYVRSDSSWANVYETPLEAHGEHFNSSRGESILDNP